MHQSARNFLKAVFKFSILDFLLITLCGAFKYWLESFDLIKKIQTPFIIAFISSLVLLVIGTGIMGIIENKFGSYKKWEDDSSASMKKKLLIYFNKSTIIIPVCLGYLLVIYIFEPTNLTWFLLLLAGIVIRNIVDYFIEKDKEKKKQAA